MPAPLHLLCTKLYRPRPLRDLVQRIRLRDTYGVEIDPGQDDALILADTVCIDEMAHGGR